MLKSTLSRNESLSQLTESGTISMPRRSRASPGKSAVLSVTTPMSGTTGLLHRDDVGIVRLAALGDLDLQVRVGRTDRLTERRSLVASGALSPVDGDDLTPLRFGFGERPEDRRRRIVGDGRQLVV